VFRARIRGVAACPGCCLYHFVLERVLRIVQARVRWFLMVEMESFELRRARARIGMAEQVAEEVRSEMVVAGGIADQAESECLKIEVVEEGIG
jgi:hypothetical protein